MLSQICYLLVLFIQHVTNEFLPQPLEVKNGRNCETRSFPYVVSIKTTFDMMHVCGGSLIDERNVLSAAHCYEPGLIYYVVAGQTSFNVFTEDVQLSPVTSVFVHPRYNKTSVSKDIAIFRLKNSMAETESVKYVRLPEKHPEHCDELAVAGWGFLMEPEFGKLRPMHLQCISLQFLNHSLCSKFYNASKFDVSSTICTTDRYGFQGVCNGDSGGPLMCGDVQYAIVSWGAGCSAGPAPQVFTKVSDYLTFINRTKRRPDLKNGGDLDTRTFAFYSVLLFTSAEYFLI